MLRYILHVFNKQFHMYIITEQKNILKLKLKPINNFYKTMWYYIYIFFIHLHIYIHYVKYKDILKSEDEF